MLYKDLSLLTGLVYCCKQIEQNRDNLKKNRTQRQIKKQTTKTELKKSVKKLIPYKVTFIASKVERLIFGVPGCSLCLIEGIFRSLSMHSRDNRAL